MLFWMMPDSGSNTKKDFESFLAPYKKANPNIEIKVEYYTRHNLWNKLFLMRFEDNPEGMPDIIEIPHSWTAFLTATKTIENLSLLDPSLSLNQYLSPLVSHCYKAGTKEIYALPWWMDVMALHYRADHLSQVSSNPVRDLQTWEGMQEVCAKLKEKFNDESYVPMQNSDWRGSLSIRSTLPCIWGRGSDLFTPDGEKSCFNDAQFIAGMEDYIELARKKYLPILRERGSVGTMMSGRASMFLTRRQGLGIFEAKSVKFETNTVPVPACGGGESVSFLSGINVVINSKSNCKMDAWEFIKWLTSRENQFKYATLMEVFPAVEESFDEFIFSSPKRMQTYSKIVANARTLSTNMVAATATKMLNEVLDKISTEIVDGTYKRQMLVDLLSTASKEADYLLNLYGE